MRRVRVLPIWHVDHTELALCCDLLHDSPHGELLQTLPGRAEHRLRDRVRHRHREPPRVLLRPDRELVRLRRKEVEEGSQQIAVLLIPLGEPDLSVAALLDELLHDLGGRPSGRLRHCCVGGPGVRAHLLENLAVLKRESLGRGHGELVQVEARDLVHGQALAHGQARACLGSHRQGLGLRRVKASPRESRLPRPRVLGGVPPRPVVIHHDLCAHHEVGLVLAPPDEAELLVEEEVNHGHAGGVAADAGPAVGSGE
mmetsp:Transcript_25649/g.76390  ORF Transcript_25649/g.76390 Transcript_25649/m.76390 type:complete len:256 (+) Transcript_25649:93-860(+)